MSFDLEFNARMTFLYGQLELYKIEFSNTGNNKYLEVMNEMNKTIKFTENCRSVIKGLSLENSKLKNGG